MRAAGEPTGSAEGLTTHNVVRGALAQPTLKPASGCSRKLDGAVAALMLTCSCCMHPPCMYVRS